MLEKVMKHYKDELEDVIQYSEMSKSSTDRLAKSIFADIAKEEHEHATMLLHLMGKKGLMKDSDELRDLKVKADEALQSV